MLTKEIFVSISDNVAKNIKGIFRNENLSPSEFHNLSRIAERGSLFSSLY